MKKTFHVPDMHCPACVMRLEGIEDELTGIQCTKASYHKQTLTIEWDENLVSEDQIKIAVHDQGYTIEELS